MRGFTTSLLDIRLELTEQYKVLELFCGHKGWSAPWGETTTLDIDAQFSPTFTKDILDVQNLEELGGPWDFIAASPPCETFSTGSISKHWGGGIRAYVPITKAAKLGLRIVEHTFELVDAYLIQYPNMKYVIENPRGVMRKIAPRPPTDTTWYCQWGESRAKPTDLWTNVSVLMPKCRNGSPDHDQQSRYYWKRKLLNQTGGTQGMKNAALRAIIPYKLALAFKEEITNKS